MNYLGVIPARGNSKSIPLKNISILNSRPLISYTIEAAVKSKINRFIVSTDSKRISDVSIKEGAEVIIRPSDISKDDTPTLPVVRHALDMVNEKFDAVIVLQPTSPFRTHEHIDAAIDLFEKDSEANCLVSVVEVPHNMEPFSIMKLNSGGYLDNFINQDMPIYRRQNKKKYYGRNGAAIYISQVKNLNKGILNGNILPYFMNSKVSIDIDDKEDLEMAEILIKNNEIKYL